MCEILALPKFLEKNKSIQEKDLRNWIRQNNIFTVKKASRHYLTKKCVEHAEFLKKHRTALKDTAAPATTITINNNKGGVQKTTTAVNLAALLAEMDNKVILIDFDGQGNASKYSLKPKIDEEGYVIPFSPAIKDILVEEKNNGKVSHDFIKQAIVQSKMGFDVIPNNILFNSVREELQSASAKELLLKRSLKTIENDYDFIIIDTPPTLAFEQINAYFASDYILIVTNADEFSKDGIEQTYEMIESAQDQNTLYVDPKPINVFGILITDLSETNVQKHYIKKIKKFSNENSLPVLPDMVQSTVKVQEAIAYKKPVHEHDPSSPATCAYVNLALEVDMARKKEIIKSTIA